LVKINLGCGTKHFPLPWANFDISGYCEPDYLFDFGAEVWPFDDGSVDEILACHALEHSIGLLHVMSEAYRVMIPGGRFHIEVPHPRSDFFIGDPTHVMPITPDTVALFSREWCLHCQQQGAANTPLALYLNIDFRVVGKTFSVNQHWRHLLDDDLTPRDTEDFIRCVASYSNVIDSMSFVLERV
jgi:SAM-dependent methyltransferase